MDQVLGSVQMSSKPGRPKLGEAVHTTGIADLGAVVRGQVAMAPRLLDLEAAASYLSVSTWTIRDMDAAGILPRVRVPLANGRDLRKLLFDKADLDRLIGAWKDTAA